MIAGRDVGQRPTRLILLGTAGGPRPNPYRSSAAQVILINGQAHVVACGYGVAGQLVLAGVPLDTLRRVYITHHADFGNLVLLAWASGLRTPVDAYGPPPIRAMGDLFLQLNAHDIDIRTVDEGRIPLSPLFRAHEVDRAGASGHWSCRTSCHRYRAVTSVSSVR